MKSSILAIFTRTPLHVGMGSSIGAIDQPVMRERQTGFPVIPGSAVKGVLRDYAEHNAELKASVSDLFGEQDGAGKIGFGEARILLFPLRSAKGAFAFATCPLALSRYKRDANISFDVPRVADGQCLSAESVKLGDNVALEEYVFAIQGAFPEDWAEHLTAMLDDEVLREGKTHLVLLSDGDFAYFCKNACQMQHHNKIGENGTVDDGALFSTETVPSETLFYTPIHALRAEAESNPLYDYLTAERILQFGANSTTGLGFSTVKLMK